jgi:hypothetical protein
MLDPAQDPMPSTTRNPEYVRRFEIARRTAKQGVTMAKVRIRQATADNPWPHWHILSFTGPDGQESRGVVDLIAVRKDHGEPLPGTKRGDALQIILIQVKGGSAAKPTPDDATTLPFFQAASKMRKLPWRRAMMRSFCGK